MASNNFGPSTSTRCPSPSSVDILSGSPHDGDGARGGVGVGGVALTWKEMENDDDREFTRFGRRSREGEIPKITAPDSQKAKHGRKKPRY